MELGSITITYEMNDNCDIDPRLIIDGDLPMITQLGLLELAKDTILGGDDG